MIPSAQNSHRAWLGFGVAFVVAAVYIRTFGLLYPVGAAIVAWFSGLRPSKAPARALSTRCRVALPLERGSR